MRLWDTQMGARIDSECGFEPASGPRDRARGAAAALAHGALELLSPTRCAGCERAGELVCPRCIERLELIDPRLSCTGCGAPFGSMLCTECRGEAGEVDRCLAAAVFADPLARIIRSYKDAGERRLSEPLAEMLYDAALHAESVAPGRYGGILSRADAVAFVPVTGRAFARRGFDHMEEIARALCGLAGLRLVDALAKHGAADQRRLGRSSRLAGSRGAYEVVADVAGLRLLLVDDVITTGATINSSAAALRRAGARTVDALALARVW